MDNLNKLIGKGELNENGEKTGVWEYYFANDILASKYTYLNDILHGSYEIYWYNKKTLSYKGNYVHGKNMGTCEWYNTSGIMESRAIMIDGVYNGLYEQVDFKGNITLKGFFVDDKKVGVWTSYLSYSYTIQKIVEKNFYL